MSEFTNTTNVYKIYSAERINKSKLRDERKQDQQVTKMLNAIYLPNINKSPFIIGRSKADLNIEESYISNIHAIISYKDGKYRVADYASTNGTSLDGKELKPKVYYEVRDGQTITLADREKIIFYSN